LAVDETRHGSNEPSLGKGNALGCPIAIGAAEDTSAEAGAMVVDDVTVYGKKDRVEVALV
jgi:hypothetical protein